MMMLDELAIVKTSLERTRPYNLARRELTVQLWH
jgi:hypothetical protein